MWEQIVKLMNIKIWGTSLLSIVITLLVFTGCILITLIIRFILTRVLRKWIVKNNVFKDDTIIKLIKKNLFPLLYFGSLWIAIQNLNLPHQVNDFFSKTGVVLLTFFIIKGTLSVTKYILKHHWSNNYENEKKIKTMEGLFPAISIFIWLIGFVFLMGNLGLDISGLIAGLGISGIAVAIASQSILGDVFNYFAIIIDRPFEIGDFIIFDNVLGVVEHVGLKTTRIRSLWGEQIILSNSDLTKTRIKNYKRMEERRVEFKFGVVYDTAPDQLRTIPAMVREIIEANANTRFDRAHFFSFQDYYLEFDVIYYINNPDYNMYMDIQQSINIMLKEKFLMEKISFAFPTQEIILKKDNPVDALQNSAS